MLVLSLALPLGFPLARADQPGQELAPPGEAEAIASVVAMIEAGTKALAER
jgi:hypothetical protein